MKCSLTKLFNKLKDLEAHPDTLTATDQAKQLFSTLQDLDKGFRAAHLDVIDSIEEESDLKKEHKVLDKHEDDVSSTSVCLQALMKSTLSVDSSTQSLSRKLSRVERCLREAEEALGSMEDSDGKVPLLEQQLSDLKKELTTMYEQLVVLDLSDEHDWVTQHAALESLHFKCSHRVRKLLSTQRPCTLKPSSASSETGSKLQKLKVPPSMVMSCIGNSSGNEIVGDGTTIGVSATSICPTLRCLSKIVAVSPTPRNWCTCIRLSRAKLLGQR